MGMGRTGTAAYDALSNRGSSVIGLDSDPYIVESHATAGRNVVYTDAEDANFWHGIDLSGIEAVVLSMDALESKLIAARQLRARAFTGTIVAHALHQDEVDEILRAGASETYLTKYEAGVGLAEHTWKALDAPNVSPAVQD
jgi:Trk K+ transport system NAD-binding subunit